MNKLFCYFILFIAFLISFQTNPMGILIIVCIPVGLYLINRVRKNRKKNQAGVSDLETLLALVLNTQLNARNDGQGSSVDDKAMQWNDKTSYFPAENPDEKEARMVLGELRKNSN